MQIIKGFERDYFLINNAIDNSWFTKKQKFTEIMWNETTKEGRVKDTMHFGDTDWHCWDADLQDTDCN